ncbi:MAG: hypothetical protein NPIRA03_06710 [Nitrospirales bacterium]|nr:MAG: hypothetical protein NPIRA03_06710 [Nitrospirales bacterium]
MDEINQILESLKNHVADLEATGADPVEITNDLLTLLGERCQAHSGVSEVEGLVFDSDELMLMSIGTRLAAKRSERRGITTDPILALLAYSSEQALALLGREKLRSVLEGQCAELTCPADFWGKG